MDGEIPDLLICGGGPAGMMAGLLFARAGVKTLVLEKHGIRRSGKADEPAAGGKDAKEPKAANGETKKPATAARN